MCGWEGSGSSVTKAPSAWTGKARRRMHEVFGKSVQGAGGGEGKGPYSSQNPLKGGNHQDEARRNGIRASPDTGRRPASRLPPCVDKGWGKSVRTQGGGVQAGPDPPRDKDLWGSLHTRISACFSQGPHPRENPGDGTKAADIPRSSRYPLIQRATLVSATPGISQTPC